MDLIVDANILFAALIKKGRTADLLFAEEFHLFAPEFLFQEFSKFEKIVLEKTLRTKQEFDHLLDVLGRRITLIPAEEIRQFLPEARKISPDPKDTPYFATALKLNASLWSNDKELKRQKEIKVYTTQELLRFLSRS